MKKFMLVLLAFLLFWGMSSPVTAGDEKPGKTEGTEFKPVLLVSFAGLDKLRVRPGDKHHAWCRRPA